MGFLNVKGSVLTYNQYKDKIEQYKRHGLMQFKSLYNAHKSKYIPLKDLKWGEEMEFQLQYIDKKTKKVQLSNRGPELIKKFNESPLVAQSQVMLMPEFGGWMVEAVPTKPYGSLIDAAELLSCEQKLMKRRIVLEEFFKEYGLSITSFSNAPTLGTPNHIHI